MKGYNAKREQIMKRLPKIVQLEERIVLDAAVAAVVLGNIAPNTADHAVNDQPAQQVQPANQQSDDPQNTNSANNQVNVIYVNQNATGTVQDGASWNTAYKNLQDALNQAANMPGKDQIWIAEGVYTPSKVYDPNGVIGGASGATADNLKTFDIPNNVEIYGGFEVGMTSLSQRNSTLHATILSGDLLGNDINDPANPGYAASKADNAWHVVMMGNDIAQTGVTARLDGITIQDGYAAGPGLPLGQYLYNHNFGGGAYISYDSNVVIENVTFRYNYAGSDGGGLYSNNSNVLVSDSHFYNNTAVVRAGGYEALNTFETNPHTAKVVNSLFENNVSYTFGGAIVAEGTFPDANSSFSVKGSVFTRNTAAEGGAIVIDSMTTFVDKSIFTNNVGHVSAGALATTNVVNTLFGGPNSYVTTVSNSIFTNNVAEGDLAAHQALNNMFSGGGLDINFARGGGALVSYMTGHLIVNNSIFTGNIAESGDGGAILNGGSLTTAGGFPFAASAETIVNQSVFIGNRTLDGNGGTIASTSLLGLLDPNTSQFANKLQVNFSKFVGNEASRNGGAFYLSGTTANIYKNLFFGNDNAQSQGDQIYGANSKIDEVLSSASDAESVLLKNNIFLLLSDDDITLTA